MKLNNITYILFILTIYQTNFFAQESIKLKYAQGLAEITAFADTPGFNDEITIKNEIDSISWFKGQDGFYYTQEIEYSHAFAYKVLYKEDKQHIVSTLLNSEGTAEYSFILRLEIDHRTIKLLEVITGGDRCQKGLNLDDVTIENGIMSYAQFITPHHLMSWGNKEVEFGAYANCMVCCCGFANFSYDLKAKKKNFENILLLSEYLPNEGHIRTIYDKFIKDKPIKLSLSLNEQELSDFINQVKNKSNE